MGLLVLVLKRWTSNNHYTISNNHVHSLQQVVEMEVKVVLLDSQDLPLARRLQRVAMLALTILQVFQSK